MHGSQGCYHVEYSAEFCMGFHTSYRSPPIPTHFIPHIQPVPTKSVSVPTCSCAGSSLSPQNLTVLHHLWFYSTTLPKPINVD